jgi:Papain family cysteine protease
MNILPSYKHPRGVSWEWKFLVGGVLALSLTSLGHAQSNDFPTEDPPDDAIILTEEEARPFLQEDGVRIPQPEEEEAARRKRLTEDESLVQRYLEQHKDVASRFQRFEPNDSTTTPVGDGNYKFPLRSKAGEEQEVVTMGREFLISALASSIREFPKKENQLTLYQDFYRLMHIKDPPGVVAQRFPSPRRMKRFSSTFLARRNNLLSRHLLRVIDKIKLPLVVSPPSCDEEAGYEEGRDRSGTQCGYEPGGVMQNYNFPLKPYLTCVKNQASRGTCVSFAITSAAETYIAKTYKKWTTLSEQDLYYRGAGLWYPREFGDGLWPFGVMDRMRTDAYPFAYEEQWDYNPSRFRQALPQPNPNHYENSCDGYDGSETLWCSDTAHQGQKICFPFISSWFCFNLPAPATAQSTYRLTGITELWDVGNPDLSFVKAILVLALAKKPIVFTIPVHTSWDQPNANGYIQGSGLPLCPLNNQNQCVPQAGVCECNRGGHAVTAVGFIDNSKLPSGAPAGAGGGYFIVKNSWGTCFADGGYIYVPYNWMKNLASSAIAVSTMTK